MTTRLMASVVAVVPLYAACLAVSYLTTQVVVYVISGGSTGSYLHYFSLMLSGQDILYSLIKTIIFVGLPRPCSATTASTHPAVRRAWEWLPGMR